MKREHWEEKFKQYAEAGEDPNLLPDFLDSEAIKMLESEEN